MTKNLLNLPLTNIYCTFSNNYLWTSNKANSCRPSNKYIHSTTPTSFFMATEAVPMQKSIW